MKRFRMAVCLRVILAETLLAALACAGDLAEAFRDPPRQYSLMPYWFWNGRITERETRRQIEEMIRQGIYRAVVFPWDGMEPAYLSEEYWRQLGAALEAARDLGFTLNLADELNWPSGHAWRPEGGAELSQVLERRPEFRMRRLDYEEHVIQGPRRWRLKAKPPAWFAVAARQDEAGRLEAASLRLLEPVRGELHWQAPPGRWLLTLYRLVPAVGEHNTRVDLLNPDAVRLYLDLVYEELARRFPEHLGRTIKLTIADHEGAYGQPIAWTPRLFDEFSRRYGYDLRTVLPLLANDSIEAGAAERVRSDYLELVSDLYVQAFTGQVAEWCRRRGLGHATSLYEEQFWFQVSLAGDMYRHWRAGTFVTMDALLERSRFPLDFKEAATVAHLEGMPLVVENQGLQGHDSFLGPEKMRLGTNMALLWGANVLVPYFDYDPEKTIWPPQWFRGQPFWRYFRQYADYVRRAQFMNAQGHHVAPVAIYYPLETVFANSAALFSKRSQPLIWGSVVDQVQNFYTALQLELARGGWDFHILDRRYLRQARLEHGALCVRDECFRVLVLPPMTHMDGEAASKVRAFADAGGKVLALGEQPRALEGAPIRRFPIRRHPPFMHRLDYAHPIAIPEGVREDLEPVLQALASIEPPALRVLGGRPEHLYFSRRATRDAEWFWVVNDSDQWRRVRIRMPTAAVWEKWDAATGGRCTLAEGEEVPLSMGPWDAFFLVRHEGAPAPRCADGREVVLQLLPETGWRLTIESGRVEVPYARTPQGEYVWLAPERNGIRGWWLIGPFPYHDHHGFFRSFPPEVGFRRKAGYDGAYGKVRWRWVEAPSYRIVPAELLQLPGDRRHGVYYGFVYVYSPVERSAVIVASFADSLRVWWNGQEVLGVHRHPKWLLLRDVWARKVAVGVRRGWNRLLVKVGPSLSVPTAFSLRLADADGRSLRDVVCAREPKLPPVQRIEPVRLHIEAPPGSVALEGALAAASFVPGAPELVVSAEHPPEQPAIFRTEPTTFRLASWTDSALRHYSGSALYETTFELPVSWLRRRLALDLGEVGVAAEAWLNGRPLGVRTWRPFRFEITGHVAERNHLVVRVANSDAGRLAQGETLYPPGSWGLEFRTERDRLERVRPNGLEGPVKILALD
ncbi:MAG: glycosyl hydrolase [Bryobacterales bacterium]|nr:glycosyl hydrolase [Bryobacterales bacterium]